MEQTKTEKTIQIITDQLTISRLDRPNFNGNIGHKIKLDIPYGTIIDFVDFNGKFIIGDKEHETQCEEYANLKTLQPKRKIQIKIPDKIHIAFYEIGNENNICDEITTNDINYVINNGYLILPKGTPLFNDKLYIELKDDSEVKIHYDPKEFDQISNSKKDSESDSN